jgi:putative membrane protein
MEEEAGREAVDGAAPAVREGEARDHLSNERTYLAWLRTGMALLGLGFLVARLRIELAASTPGAAEHAGMQGAAVGLGFAGLGVVTILFGTWRYAAVRRMIEQRVFAPLGSAVLLISTGALVVAIAVIFYLVERLL